MAGFWQYNDLNKFKFNPDEGKDQRVISGQQALSDWNREISSGKNTQLFIEGRSISENRNRQLFEKVEDLKDFFKTTLFSKISDEQLKERLAEESLLIFHQGGLPFASHHCLVNNKQTGLIKLPTEKIRVDFSPSEEGVLITEVNTYNRLTVGAKIYDTDTYYAKTESQVLFGKNGVEVRKMTIDCPNRDAATLLDDRTFSELFMHVVEKIMSLIQGSDSTSVPRNV